MSDRRWGNSPPSGHGRYGNVFNKELLRISRGNAPAVEPIPEPAPEPVAAPELRVVEDEIEEPDQVAAPVTITVSRDGAGRISQLVANRPDFSPITFDVIRDAAGQFRELVASPQ